MQQLQGLSSIRGAERMPARALHVRAAVGLEDAVTFVIKPGPKFEVLHTNTLADDDMGMATPVIVGDKLLIRTAPRIYCVGAAAVAATR